MRFGCFVAALIVAISPSPQARAQLPGGPHLDALIVQRSVQKELKIDPKQMREVGQVTMRNRAAMLQVFSLPKDQQVPKAYQLLMEGDKRVLGMLKVSQKHRLRQIQWQQQGSRAFADTELVKDLSLTQDQQFQINIVLDSIRGHANELLQHPSGQMPHSETFRQHMAKVDGPAMSKIQLLLNKEQKDIWKDMLGDKFTGELRFGPPRR